MPRINWLAGLIGLPIFIYPSKHIGSPAHQTPDPQVTGSQSHRSPDHRATKPQSHRLTNCTLALHGLIGSPIAPWLTIGTLAPWLTIGSQAHQLHLGTGTPPSHRPTDHRLTGITDTSHRATTTRSNGLPPLPATTTIGCLDHQNHESQGHGLTTYHLTILPTHQITRPQACYLTIYTLALHLSHNLTDTRFTGAKPPSHRPTGSLEP